jgi:gamma-butyrobetaine dioxygenase
MSVAASRTAAASDIVVDLPPTPDFDAYPLAHSVVGAVVTRERRAVQVTWDDGLISDYHVYALRENATEADMMHSVTREQRVQLMELPDDLAMTAAEPDAAGGLCVRWSTGGVSGFHAGWLRAYAEGADDDPAALPNRVYWTAEFAPYLPRFDGPTLLTDASAVDDWALALHVHGVAIVQNLPSDPAMVEQVPALIGPVRPTNFGQVFDVRSDKSAADTTSNAYTAMALPVHTDLCTREYKPGLQYLFCLQNDADGGDSLLVDGLAIAAHLRQHDPEAFEALSTIPFSYYNKATDTDFRWQTPVFVLDDSGEVTEVRWSPWLRAPQRASIETVDRAYRALRTAFRLAQQAEFTVRIRLAPGEMLCFDNRRMLHGRTGFDPATGNRWLRGCYGEREDLQSRLRIAARKQRRMFPTNAGGLNC